MLTTTPTGSRRSRATLAESVSAPLEIFLQPEIPKEEPQVKSKPEPTPDELRQLKIRREIMARYSPEELKRLWDQIPDEKRRLSDGDFQELPAGADLGLYVDAMRRMDEAKQWPIHAKAERFIGEHPGAKGPAIAKAIKKSDGYTRTIIQDLLAKKRIYTIEGHQGYFRSDDFPFRKV